MYVCICIYFGQETKLYLFLEVAVDELRDVVIFISTVQLHLVGDLLQVVDGIRSQVGNDAGEELLQLLALRRAGDDVGVGLDGGLDLRVVEVDDGAVLLEEVNLLNALDGVAAQTLDAGLQLLVATGGRRLAGLLGAANGASTAKGSAARHAGLELGASGQHFCGTSLHDEIRMK